MNSIANTSMGWNEEGQHTEKLGMGESGTTTNGMIVMNAIVSEWNTIDMFMSMNVWTEITEMHPGGTVDTNKSRCSLTFPFRIFCWGWCKLVK